MDTTDTAGQRHDAHNIYSKHFLAVFCVCESFIIRYKQTCREIFRYIGWCVANTSSLLGTDCEEKFTTRMPTWTITQHFHQITKLEATLSVVNFVSKIVEISP